MKTINENQKVRSAGLIFAFFAMLISCSQGAFAQNGSPKTIFGPDAEVLRIFSPEIKINSIQEEIGTLIGFYYGPVINRTLLIGACGGLNLGHPKVNYGYLGGIGQYIFNPDGVVHFSSQLILAFGSTKDYENPKTSPMDNFWNISGTSFMMLEPGVNLEVNISKSLVLVTGVSYRHVSGLNEASQEISLTHLTNEALSGVNFNIGLKFYKQKKGKK